MIIKKEYKLIAIIVTGTLGLMWLSVPIETTLNLYFSDQQKSELIAKVSNRFVIFLILLLAVKRLGFSQFNGTSKITRIKDTPVLTAPILLIGLGVMANWSVYSNSDPDLFILFAISVLLIGLVEEILMRGLVLPLFIKSKIQSEYALYFGVICSSIIFGIIHYINLFHQPENITGITSQVFFAISIGIFFGALMLRTGNIFLVGIFHAFVNFILGNGILEKESSRQVREISLDLPSMITTGIIIIIIIIIGLNMIRKVDEKTIKAELRNVKTSLF
ncbi:MAG: CPBP family intramembrane glutamic endopeptidase [Bacteroidota bacterium]